MKIEIYRDEDEKPVIPHVNPPVQIDQPKKDEPVKTKSNAGLIVAIIIVAIIVISVIIYFYGKAKKETV